MEVEGFEYPDQHPQNNTPEQQKERDEGEVLILLANKRKTEDADATEKRGRKASNGWTSNSNVKRGCGCATNQQRAGLDKSHAAKGLLRH